MKNLINIDIEKYETERYNKCVKFRASVSEKRGEAPYQKAKKYSSKKRKPRNEYSSLVTLES